MSFETPYELRHSGSQPLTSKPGEFLYEAGSTAQDLLGFLTKRSEELPQEIAKLPHHPGPYKDTADYTDAEREFLEQPAWERLFSTMAHTGADYGGGISGFFASLPEKIIAPGKFDPGEQSDVGAVNQLAGLIPGDSPEQRVFAQEAQGLVDMIMNAVVSADHIVQRAIMGRDPEAIANAVDPNSPLSQAYEAITGNPLADRYRDVITEHYEGPAAMVFGLQIGGGLAKGGVKLADVKKKTIKQQSANLDLPDMGTRTRMRVAEAIGIEEKPGALRTDVETALGVDLSESKIKKLEAAKKEAVIAKDYEAAAEFQGKITELQKNVPKKETQPLELEKKKTTAGEAIGQDLKTKKKTKKISVAKALGKGAATGLAAYGAGKLLSEEDSDGLLAAAGILASKVKGKKPRLRAADSPRGWTSRALDTFKSKTKGKAKIGVSELLGLLKDVPKEELKWMGVEEMIALEKKKGTKSLPTEEVEALMRENQVRMVDLEYGIEAGASRSKLMSLDTRLGNLYANLKQDRASLKNAWSKATSDRIDSGNRQIKKLEAQVADVEKEMRGRGTRASGGPTYLDYKEPGGKNYSEVLLTIDKLQKYDTRGPAEPYLGPHWEDPDVVAHVRYDTRNVKGGGETIFLEEVQSDWAAAARSRGIIGEARPELPPARWYVKELKETLTGQKQAFTNHEIWIVLPDGVEFRMQGNGVGMNPGRFSSKETALEWAQKKDMDAHIGRVQQAFDLQANAVPDMPFKKTWLDLAFKRMLRVAAEQGHERISWTTGKMQLDRYERGTENQGLKYLYDNMLPKVARKWAKRLGYEVEWVDVAGLKEPVMSVRLTPKAKKTIVEKGLPIISAAGLTAAGLVSQEGDGILSAATGLLLFGPKGRTAKGKIARKRIADGIASITKDGGTTLRLQDGLPSKRQGYLVDVTSRKMKLKELTPEVVERFLDEHHESITKHPDKLGLGMFSFENNLAKITPESEVSIGLAMRFKTQQAAERVGAELGEHSAWKTETKRKGSEGHGLSLGGKGEGPYREASKLSSYIRKMAEGDYQDVATVGAWAMSEVGADFGKWKRRISKELEFKDATKGVDMKELFADSKQRLRDLLESSERETLPVEKELMARAKKAFFSKEWFTGFMDAVKDLYPHLHEEMAKVYAIISQGAEVTAGASMGMKFFSDYTTGIPVKNIKVGRFPKQTTPKVLDAIRGNYNVFDPKIGTFLRAIDEHLAGSEQSVTVDLQMGRLFGFLTEKTTPTKTTPTRHERTFIQAAVKSTARALKISEKKAQAALWGQWKLENDLTGPATRGRVPHYDQALYKRLDDAIFKGDLEKLFPGHSKGERVTLTRLTNTIGGRADRWLDPAKGPKGLRTGVPGENVDVPRTSEQLSYMNVYTDNIIEPAVAAVATQKWRTEVAKGRIYDAWEDPRGLVRMNADNIQRWEQNIYKSGFLGYTIGNGVARVFDPLKWRKVAERASVDKPFMKLVGGAGLAALLAGEWFFNPYITDDDGKRRFSPAGMSIGLAFLAKRGRAARKKMSESVGRVYDKIDFNVKYKVPFKDAITDKALGLSYGWFDSFAPLEYVEKKMRGVKELDPTKIDPATSPTMIGRASSQTAGSRAREWVTNGTFDRSGQWTGTSLMEALDPVVDNIHEALTYSYAARAIELHKRGINPGITLEDAQATVKELKSKRFERVHSEITAFGNRGIDYLVESGGMSREAADIIMKLNAAYIPLKRAIVGDFVTTGGRKYSDLPSPIKRIKGSDLPIRNPLESLIENAASIISIADKSAVGAALVELYDLNPGGAGRWMEEVPQKQQKSVLTLGRMKKELEEVGVDLSGADMDQVLTIYSNAGIGKSGNNVINIYKDGKLRSFTVHKRLAGTMKAMDIPQIPTFVDILAGVPARTVRLGATGLNAGFGLITNPIRDAFTFALQSEYTSGLPHEIAKGLLQPLANKDMNTLWKRSGADMSQFLGMDRKQIKKAVSEVLRNTKKRKALGIVEHPIEGLKDLFSISEAGPRRAEFAAAYKKGEQLWGKNSESAFIMANLAASDVTINFRRAGVYGQYINKFIPFWNAQVQGVHKFARFAKAHPMKAGIKGLAYLTVPTVMLWMENKDETWYRESPAWLRYGFWNFRVGTNQDGSAKVLRIPRPFEWAVVFGTAPEMVLDYWHSKDPAVANDGLKYMYEQTIPVGPEQIPTSLKVPIEMYANYDFFRERPIDPYFEVEYKEPEDRWGPYTTETSKYLSERLGEIPLIKNLGLSPRKLDHMIANYTGGLARDLVKSAERAAGVAPELADLPANIPVVGRLFARTDSPEKRLERIGWERNEAIQQMKNKLKAGKVTEANDMYDLWQRMYRTEPDLMIPGTFEEMYRKSLKKEGAK